MTAKVRRKYIPCYVVIRLAKEDSLPPHVMGVFEHFDQAEVMVDKYNDEYKRTDVGLYCEIQPSDYCTS
jgi:hypothetical protein